MRRIKTALTFCIFCLALFGMSLEVKATLIPVDYPEYRLEAPFGGGPGVVLDTTTQKEWMNIFKTWDIYDTGYRKYDRLMWYLAPGNPFAGWKIASAAEVFTLMGDAGLPTAAFHDSSEEHSAAITIFQSLLGASWTGSDDEYRYTWGIVSDSSTPGVLSSISVNSWQEFITKDGDSYMKLCSSCLGVEAMSIQSFQDWGDSNPVGAWLVRDVNPVPEPSTIVLLGGSIIGLLGFKAWRKNS